jgi:ubiquinone/menaquinone biosynthesis C-methylase UbiE
VRAVAPFVAAGARSLLDVATGGGDVAAAIRRKARARGADLRVTVLDRNPLMLDAALRRDRSLAPVLGDALALPFPDRAFDVAHCSLFLHHLEPDGAVRLLRELRRVARLAAVVVDLRRHRVAHAAISLLTRVAFRSDLVRYDGPLSVLRAYTPGEVSGLCRDAGLPAPRIERALGFRMATVFDRRAPGER